MKLLTLVLVLATIAFCQTAPTPTYYAVGVSANPGNSPSMAGTAMYAKQVTTVGNQPTYAFGVLDILPETYKPITVTTNFGGGIAQQVTCTGKVCFYIPLSAGFTFNGTNMGWNWSFGGMATIPIKGNVKFAPNFRTVKTTVNNYSGYQVIPGVMFMWGK